MYRKDRFHQFGLSDFNQPFGLKMNPENRWVKKPEENNSGTMLLDASCAPQNISYPQDVNLLNEARENLEDMIDSLCFIYYPAGPATGSSCGYNVAEKPRTYRNNARRDYLNLARSKKRTSKRIRLAIKQQLQYVR